VEQNVVRLSGGTTLKIDTLTVSDTGADTVSDTELDLQAGRIFASVKKLSDTSKYLVKIPNGIAGCSRHEIHPWSGRLRRMHRAFRMACLWGFFGWNIRPRSK
jgi:hypothetical protein